MKRWILLPACFLLLWTLTEGDTATDPKITVSSIPDGVKLSCGKGNKMTALNKNKEASDEYLMVQYKDDNSGEYQCMNGTEPIIYVKFRTCDNCIELDAGSIAGLVVGNVVATIVIGVAVYIIASQNRISPVTMDKKRSDRQHLIPNEPSNRAPNDHYQPLRHKSGQKDTYDLLNNKQR